MKILCIHGVGRHPRGGNWETDWSEAIKQSLERAGTEPDTVEVSYVYYDDLFARQEISWTDVLSALWKLGSSAATSLTRGRSAARGGRGFGDLGTRVRWTAGMVVKWVEDSAFRRATRRRVRDGILREEPDVICAHSLGSLVAYDLFSGNEGRELLEDRVLMTFGSQIGNAFVRGNFSGGRIVPLAAKFWFHLYNPNDVVFTARIRLTAPNFREVTTAFDEPDDMADHDADQYLAHRHTVDRVWEEIVLESTSPSAAFALQPMPERVSRSIPAVRTTVPERRALLVGINDYPIEGMQLDGCVNDVYLMSSFLQETGFQAEDIRMILDQRATAQAIRDRIDWLLDGVQPGDTRVLYFSGHGAQIPTYGIGDRVDRRDEALVPWDFDWRRENAIVDDQLYEIYSQLPYGVNFTAVFDCCHSGGLTRSGSQKVRGISAPDDIRHRAMAWDGNNWLPREIEAPNPDEWRHLNAGGPASPIAPEPATHRLGQAMSARGIEMSKKMLRARQRELQHQGPYMPTLFYACRETELAYEYRHGATSYGAFTYSLVKHLRALKVRRQTATPNEILSQVRAQVSRIAKQEPQLVVPSDVAAAPVTWLGRSPNSSSAKPKRSPKKTTAKKRKGKK